MKIDLRKYQAPHGSRLRLKDWATRGPPLYPSKARCSHLLAKQVKKLSKLQNLLYANNEHSLLIIFQAMDAAGKDGAIKHVMSGVNPQGCQVFSFKHPGPEALAHDFLWRTTACLPERGRIGIFNRSYYEEVLILKVHPEILRGEGLPPEALADPDFWEHRYHSIRESEKHLLRNGTRIVKFFLHLSKEEQRRRFLARIDTPEKRWKFSRADLTERGRWNDYERAYEECLAATSTRGSPWHIVPADDKPNAWLIISQVIIKALADLKMSFPVPDRARLRELRAIRRLLEK
jgi:PPK2 family polyphosphate:nucleotide phosphotransferase